MVKFIFIGCAPSEDAQLKCVGAAVKYLDLGRNTQFKAKSLEISRYAKLDASIFENLHLCSLKETSLFSILSAACQTTQGARLLRKWITQVEILKVRKLALSFKKII